MKAEQELDVSVQKTLAKAEAACVAQGGRFTRHRREILELLLRQRKPVKAYDLIEQIRQKTQENLTPAAIYRSLNFLIELGFVHRINSQNAFVACTGHAQHKTDSTILFVCSRCNRAEEIEDEELCRTIRQNFAGRGLLLDDNAIEVQGLCAQCAREEQASQQDNKSHDHAHEEPCSCCQHKEAQQDR